MTPEEATRLLKDRLSEKQFFDVLHDMIEVDIRSNNSLERADRDADHVYYHGATQALRRLLNRLTELYKQAQEEIANGQV